MSNTKQISVIDAYIGTFPTEVQVLLQKLKKTIKSAAPKSSEGISYGVPTFYLNGKYLVYFAAFKNHIGIYPATTTAVQKAGLSAYKVAKGTLRFPLSKPIPFELIKKFVKYRIAEQVTQSPTLV